MSHCTRITAGLALAVLATAATAQNTVTVGIGPQSAPAYFGSDETEIGVTGSFSVQELNFGPLRSGGSTGGTAEGFGYGGSFRYIGERSADDYSELTGLTDLDAVLELGAQVSYTTAFAEAFAQLRYGVVGHSSLVGELGADLIARPTDRITLKAGPRLFFADSDYADRYFGVSASEAAANAAAGGTLDAYAADGGLLSRGIEASAAYAFSRDWGVTGTVRYDEYVGDAGDSPIVLQGSDTATTASVVLTRRISF
ncbi:MipA/OmpV family protein [Loktanella sp. SALINAS62]|uniref:MipA/OmpV family protein n=1 Tax=Loktanella sp. SALINAS62 TaxID=2706124 RepID=UPI001B8C9781|nr:MipA/OmpV family protein [Loktanella sp. SALINAS62]MBS1303923.1 MipA/OmpV family protein [Loktanella sp. SALINAS62]